MYLIDSNVYIRAFRELTFGLELQAFHRAHLPRLVVSAVVMSELLVDAQKPDRERVLGRTLLEPFLARRRFITPTWSTWELATRIDRQLRQRPTYRSHLKQRSFLQDILIATSARENGATIVTFNTADFTLIGRYVDIAFVKPWPTAPGP
ncbi:MAG: type II toxin-antitoxin system VapC family toxin [Gemmatimonas sp.]